jgi:hypothetical protein
VGILVSPVWSGSVVACGMTVRMTTRASNDAWVGCGGARLQRQVPDPDPPVRGRARPNWRRPGLSWVGDNVWLGGGVMVRPGGGIGENTVVGAGAVGSGTCPPTWSPLPPSPRHPLAVTADHRRERSAVGTRSQEATPTRSPEVVGWGGDGRSRAEDPHTDRLITLGLRWLCELDSGHEF